MATTLPGGDPATANSLAHPSTTNAQQKLNFTALRNFIADLFGTDSTVATAHSAFRNFGVGTSLNVGLAASVGAGALTVSLKTAAGTDPSATDPVLHAFRSATAATGTPSLVAATAAQTVVVPSGATMGATNGAPFRLWVVQFNDSGALRLGVINCLNVSSGVVSIYPLRDDVIATAALVSTASDNAHVIYASSAVTSRAMRVLGWMEWSSGLTTAGTWDAVPTKIQLYAQGQSLPGQEVQVQETVSTGVSTGATTIPLDDTIPQNTEGNEYLSQSITPTSVANVLAIDTTVHISNSAGTAGMVAALFQDSTANAIAAGVHTVAGVGHVAALRLSHRMRGGTTSSTSFKVRAGFSGAGTNTVNGVAGARLMGGVMNSYIRATELMA